MKINGKHYRTIWPDPATDNKTIQIIDQRYLPHAFVIEGLNRPVDFQTAIRDMHVRGAGLIGATAGFGMYSVMLSSPQDETAFVSYLEKESSCLVETRPTARNLAWAVERQLKTISGEKTRENKIAASFQTACDIADEDASSCKMIGEHGLAIIKEISRRKKGAPVNILTHCNAGWLAFVDFGSATAPIYAAHDAGIAVHVWVDETRPWLQGSRLTAWELQKEGVPHTLIVDNAGGHLMQHGFVDLVLVGTDRVTRTGDVANKIGTYLKAVAAVDCGVPFYVALPSSTIDWRLADGLADIPIELRAEEEVTTVSCYSENRSFTSISIAPLHTRAANYSFDVTPARLITGLITERGVVRPEETAMAAAFPEFT